MSAGVPPLPTDGAAAPRSGERAPETVEVGPHGVTLAAQARITAALAEGDTPYSEVLAAHGLDDPAWSAATIYWMKRLGDDALEHGERATLALLYSEAFSQAQDALKPLPELDVEGYAAIVAEIQATGSPAQPLAKRRLSNADYLRLSRHFAAVLSADAAQAKRYFTRLQALQPAAHEVDV